MWRWATPCSGWCATSWVTTRRSWLVVRNLSNPAIDGRLPRGPNADIQGLWSGFYYDTYGYWTSVNSSIACWALLAP